MTTGNSRDCFVRLNAALTCIRRCKRLFTKSDGVPFVEREVVLTIRIRRLAGTANLPTDVSFRAAQACAWRQASGVIMAIGTVKFFNAGKGFGFVAPEDGGKDVFVHVSAVEAAGMRVLAEGQRISFDTQSDAKGAKAVNLKAA
jgi:CspA family cold shock protein